jgi:hypothetical protein
VGVLLATLNREAWGPRFLSKVAPGSGGCLLWTGATTRRGYGQFYHEGRLKLAHRVLYAHTYGPIPPGLVVCHACDTPGCVNPAHLWVGTVADNQRDMAEKGRAPGTPGPKPDRHGTRSTSSKLTAAQVCAIRQAHAAGVVQRELAARYGVAQMTISRAVRGESYQDVPCPPSISPS